MSELLITERQAGDITILDLTGKIRHGDGVLVLRRNVRRLLEEGRPKILLNFENVTCVDDSALMDIKATLLRSVQKEGGELRAINVHNIKDVNQVTRLVTLLDLDDSEVAALNVFQ